MLRRSHKNKKYSTELKLNEVPDYPGGSGTAKEIYKKYVILSDKQLCTEYIKDFYEESNGVLICRHMCININRKKIDQLTHKVNV